MRFVRNTWYGAAWSNDLAQSFVSRTLLNEPVLLYRKTDGTPVALADICPHRHVPLSMGKRVGDDVECLYHGLRFDSAGACVDNPNGAGAIPKAACVRGYPLTERYGMVWIWMGDPDAADPDLVPDLTPMADPENFVEIHGYLHVKANYRLMLDNLTDLSHAAFLHVDTFEPREMAREIFKVSQEGETIWAKLYFNNMAVPKAFENMPDLDDKVDHWLDMRCDPPGVEVTYFDVAKPGTSREEGYKTFNPNIITPETDYTTHYFWGGARNFLLGDEKYSTMLRELGQIGLEKEDKAVLEAQQCLLGQRDLMDTQPVLLPNDTASGRARRRISHMLDKEIAQGDCPIEARHDRVREGFEA